MYIWSVRMLQTFPVNDVYISLAHSIRQKRSRKKKTRNENFTIDFTGRLFCFLEIEFDIFLQIERKGKEKATQTEWNAQIFVHGDFSCSFFFLLFQSKWMSSCYNLINNFNASFDGRSAPVRSFARSFVRPFILSLLPSLIDIRNSFTTHILNEWEHWHPKGYEWNALLRMYVDLYRYMYHITMEFEQLGSLLRCSPAVPCRFVFIRFDFLVKICNCNTKTEKKSSKGSKPGIFTSNGEKMIWFALHTHWNQLVVEILRARISYCSFALAGWMYISQATTHMHRHTYSSICSRRYIRMWYNESVQHPQHSELRTTRTRWHHNFD